MLVIRFSFQKSLSKFTQKQFYEIDPVVKILGIYANNRRKIGHFFINVAPNIFI
jgi:hypothetical protein